jgi:PIN domain nuclease of toxin-antitoxin system
MLNLDTHILLHALAGNLTARESELLRSDSWGVSGIVLWEIAKLAELGRIGLDLDDSSLMRALSGVHVWSIDLEVCRAIRRLDVKGDPADELIAATSLVHGAALVTRDRALRRSKIVPLATG